MANETNNIQNYGLGSEPVEPPRVSDDEQEYTLLDALVPDVDYDDSDPDPDTNCLANW